MIYMTDEYQADAVLFGQPLTHARILWDKLPGTITASSSADGRPAERAGEIDTASWWMPASAPGWWQIAFPSPQVVDAVGIAAHQLDGVRVTVSGRIYGTWVELIEVTPADRSAILMLFRAVEVDAIRVTIGAARLVGVIYTGAALAMPVDGYVNMGALDLGRTASLTSYVSEGGQLLKRYLQRTGLSGSVAWEQIREPWYREHFDPFVLRAMTEPFFMAFRPRRGLKDCVYAWVDDVITPARMGVQNFMSVSFDIQAHAAMLGGQQ